MPRLGIKSTRNIMLTNKFSLIRMEILNMSINCDEIPGQLGDSL